MIVFCGYANSDVTAAVPALPAAGQRIQAVAVERGDGGMAANAAAAAARLGADARFAGAVGADALSTAFLDTLAADGVDVSPTRRNAQLTTALVLLTPDGERSIISQDDDLDGTDIAEAARQAAGGWLYLDGYRFPDAASVLPDSAASVLPDRARVVVDLDGCETRSAAIAALGAAEHVVLGRTQATALLGDDDAWAQLAQRHDVHVVVTDGGRGALLVPPEGPPQQIPPIDVSVVDSTGAGDCFVGAYCTELARDASPASAARFAAVAAGLSCTRAGARAGLPYRAAVLSRLEAGGSGPDTGSPGKERTPCDAS
ncbi:MULTISPECIES: carbohydrate kinase family protein [Prauserella salsuginis group]|uniref:Carbohydrate kinase family protein n=1 Tax=Prauserella salsuginis TaxID=387889 RepID=A0ABW6G5A1_9PSEU|nr:MULTISPECIES: carbohydrate kinase family protein [Prauserella salsuginis group]MCR3718913.1 sulfofructose kinase [Prauserella flava]MCR3733483.1 sulfofructose kinase [Prauserella salsuginis]